MTDREKLTALMDQFAQGNQRAFADIIGVPRSNIATWLHRGAITANGREAILDAFPQVSREWLQDSAADATSDELPMTYDRPGMIYFSQRDLIPLFEECRASCGVDEQFGNPEYATDHIHIPGVRAYAALPAEGASMEPTIHAGDLCLVGDEVSLLQVSSQRIYLIITRQGQRMFKRIYDEGQAVPRVLALSENPDYTPHAQPFLKADILHVYPLKYVLRAV